MIKFKIGCDPELFIKYNGSYKSAVGLIGGSKYEPLKIDNLGSAILEDNVAVEFNTQPAKSKQEFRSAIARVLDHLRVKMTGYELVQDSAAFFPEEELNTPQAQEFGCEPDFDAWNKCVNVKPCAADKTLRSCGGHVHVGSVIAKKQPLDVIKAMDIFLGVPSVILDPGTLRRELYGKAGCFRPKKYGVEYRTLSNFWIFNPDLIDWVFDGTQKALQFISDGNLVNEDHGKLVQAAINTGNTQACEKLMNYYGIKV